MAVEEDPLRDRRVETPAGEGEVVSQRRDQVLKLVAKGFFNELVKYGVQRDEVVRVASHLLDNLLVERDRAEREPAPRGLALTIDAVTDAWEADRQVSIGDVTLRPLALALVPRVRAWLQAPSVRDHFVPAFPDDEAALRAYFERPGQDYFGIYYQDAAVGIIGGEHVDVATGKLEMKKLVGEAALRGKGIGKRATFAFLYYAFMIRGMHKVYVHSRDLNVRNINLNSGFGFELEGVFLEDLRVGGRRADVIRMALLKPLWLAAFGARDG